MQNYLSLVKQCVKEDYAVIVIDNSDIAKPASRKLEALSEIRDGSTGETTQGYLTIEAAVLSESGKIPLPVYEKEFYICMGSGNIQHELLKYFYFRSDTATVSAFHQQRSKLKPETFLHLLRHFNSHFQYETYKEKYRLIACDGSEFNMVLCQEKVQVKRELSS